MTLVTLTVSLSVTVNVTAVVLIGLPSDRVTSYEGSVNCGALPLVATIFITRLADARFVESFSCQACKKVQESKTF